jgi:hypothetical protein
LRTGKSPLERDQICTVAAEPLEFCFLWHTSGRTTLCAYKHCCGEETSRVPTILPVVSFTLILTAVIKGPAKFLVHCLTSRNELILTQTLSTVFTFNQLSLFAVGGDLNFDRDNWCFVLTSYPQAHVWSPVIISFTKFLPAWACCGRSVRTFRWYCLCSIVRSHGMQVQRHAANPNLH